MKKKKRKSSLLKSILIVVIGLILINLFYSFLILEVVNFDMHINVENRMGFNVTNSLEFGTSYPGGISSKEIFIENKDYKKTRVIIKSYGDLKKWIIVSENNFIMNKGDIKTIKVDVYVPNNAEYKGYYGKLKIMFLRY